MTHPGPAGELKALLFDLDGTLVDTEELHRQSFNRAFQQFDLGWSWTPEMYTELLNVSGGIERLGAYIGTLPVPAGERARLRHLVPGIHSQKTRLYADLLRDGIRHLRPGVARLLREARDNNLKIGIAATSTMTNVPSIIEATLGLETFAAVGAIVSGDMVNRKKPAPDIYNLLVTMLRVSPVNCVAFEDSANGLIAAKAAGICTIVTPSPWTKTQGFAGADLRLEKLGSPDDPLDQADASRVGAAQLGLDQVRDLHAASIASRHEAPV
ncbi:MAG: HAD-IA family hydrolase [Alphaproteobacteria bacterium]|nr:HAD-IA family hydrolase [Alphaproteobacteria bacterium]